jgi:hypothetical protein
MNRNCFKNQIKKINVVSKILSEEISTFLI